MYWINESNQLVYQNDIITQIGDKYIVRKPIENIDFETGSTIIVSNLIEHKNFVKIYLKTYNDNKKSVYDYVFHSLVDNQLQKLSD